MNLRTRLALGVTAFSLILMTLSFAVVTLIVRDHLIESRYAQLDQAEQLMEDDSSAEALIGLQEDAVLLERDDGRWTLVAEDDDDKRENLPSDLPAIPDSGEPFMDGEWFGIVSNNQAYLFPDDGVQDTVSTLVFAFAVVLGIVALLAFIGSFLFAYQALKPLRTLGSTMERISESGTLETIEDGRTDEIGQLSRAFNRMIGRVDEMMERQRLFVADVSHEMKTPLTVIEGYANLLKRWGKTDERILDESIDNILDETGAMRTGLIEPMLELSRLGHVESTKEPVDLPQLGRELAERMQLARGTSIPVDASGTITANREAVLRILTIYLDNALKYAKMPELYLRPERLEVLDRGTSLSPSDREKLFDRFFRLDEARDRSGSGLGLAIAKATAEHHGMHVGSNEREGGGSVFYVAPDRSRRKK